VQTTGPLVTGAELPVAGDHVLDGEVSLCANHMLKFFSRARVKGESKREADSVRLIAKMELEQRIEACWFAD